MLFQQKIIGMIKANLTWFKGFLDGYRSEHDYSVLKVRFEKTKFLLSEFENTHLEIEIAENSDDHNSKQLFEENYYEQIARA